MNPSQIQDYLNQNAKFDFKIHSEDLFVYSRKKTLLKSVGEIFTHITNRLPDDSLVCFAMGNVHYFHEHFSSMIRMFQDHAEAKLVFSDHIHQNYVYDKSVFPHFLSIRQLSDINDSLKRFSLSFICQKNIITNDLRIFSDYLSRWLPYFYAIQHKDGIYYTKRATILYSDDIFHELHDNNQQQQIIKDFDSDAIVFYDKEKVVESILTSEEHIKVKMLKEMIKSIPINKKLQSFLIRCYKKLFK